MPVLVLVLVQVPVQVPVPVPPSWALSLRPAHSKA